MAKDKHDATFGDAPTTPRTGDVPRTPRTGDFPRTPRTGDAAGTPDHDRASVTLHEERLLVGTEKVRAGAVRFRTKIITEETTVTVPLRREVLELIELDDDPDTLTGVKGLRKPREIVLHEERVAIETVAYERVRISRAKATENVAVDAEVRREVLSVEDDVRR